MLSQVELFSVFDFKSVIKFLYFLQNKKNRLLSCVSLHNLVNNIDRKYLKTSPKTAKTDRFHDFPQIFSYKYTEKDVKRCHNYPSVEGNSPVKR